MENVNNIATIVKKEKEKDVVVIPEPTSGVDFAAQQFDPAAYWLDKMVLKEGITMIAGYSGAGKTWITMEMAIQIAMGGKAFGVYQCDQAPVLIVNEEDTKRGLNEKFRGMCTDPDIPVFFHIQSGVKLDNEETVNQLLAQCEHYGIRVVIFDNLTQLHNVNENSSGEMMRVFDQMKRFVAAGISVIIVHHYRKDNGLAGNMDNGSGIRGSGSMFNAVNIAIELSKTKDLDRFIVELKQTKNKDDEKIKQVVQAELHIIGEKPNQKMWFEFLGLMSQEVSASFKLQDSICSIIEGKENMKTKEQIMESTNKSHQPVDTALKELMRLGRVTRSTYAQLGIKVGKGSSAYLYWTTSPNDREQTFNLDESSIPF